MTSEYIHFIVEDVDVAYSESNMGCVLAPHDHFELRSLSISETGYKSHFVPNLEVIESGGYQAYARTLIDACRVEPDDQMQLF